MAEADYRAKLNEMKKKHGVEIDDTEYGVFLSSGVAGKADNIDEALSFGLRCYLAKGPLSQHKNKRTLFIVACRKLCAKGLLNYRGQLGRTITVAEVSDRGCDFLNDYLVQEILKFR